jgi:hypothetical protein
LKNPATVILIVLLSLGAGAQSGANSSPSGTTPTSAPPAGVDADPRTSAKTNTSGAAIQLKDVTFQAELTKSLDANKLKAGDEITAKSMDEIAFGNQVIIHKGAKLIGHVTEVQPHTKENPESRLGIVFDKAILRDGKETTFHGEIRGYVPPIPLRAPSAMTSGDTASDRASGSTTGKLYNRNPNPGPTSITALEGPLPVGEDGLYLSANSSVFRSKVRTVKLVGGAQVRIYVK